MFFESFNKVCTRKHVEACCIGSINLLYHFHEMEFLAIHEYSVISRLVSVIENFYP